MANALRETAASSRSSMSTDVDVVLRRVEQQGGSVVGSARHEGILRIATFRDPEANLIGPWTESTT